MKSAFNPISSSTLYVFLAVAGSIVLTCLLQYLGGFLMVLVLHALTVGLVIQHISGEPKRIRLQVQQKTSALQNLAYRDSLTGLPNRRFFTWYLDQNLAMRIVNRRRGSHVNRVVLFDLNGFKVINDTYGHEAGDELLKFISVTLTAYLPSDALLARLGGDEFVVMVRDNHGGRKTREVEAIIRQAVSSVFVLDGHRISVSASIGTSSPATARSTAVQLVREADQRMYADKVASRKHPQTVLVPCV